MTPPNSEQPERDPKVESELVKRLTDQANRVAVSPDLMSHVERRHQSIVRRQRLASRASLVSVIVGVVVVAIGVFQVGGAFSDRNVSEPAAAADSPTELPDVPLFALADDLFPERCEVIVWLDVAVAPQVADHLSLKLSASSAVAKVEYVDQERTYEEFESYYADEPEIVALVEPEQLPTSFRVELLEHSQPLPSELAWLATADGVDQVAVSDQTCADGVVGD